MANRLRQGSSIDTWDACVIPWLSNERLAASSPQPERLLVRGVVFHP